MSTKKTDDDRNERGFTTEQQRLLDERPHDFIERTKPEDRLGEGGGQQTRDNVNPAIPSAPPGEGGIVDPSTLGMEQAAGVSATTPGPAAAAVNEATSGPVSINEPPGSEVLPPETGGGDQQPPPSPEESVDPLPSEAELERMTRSELDELARGRGVDITDAGNKQDVIDALRKDERKRRRRA